MLGAGAQGRRTMIVLRTTEWRPPPSESVTVTWNLPGRFVFNAFFVAIAQVPATRIVKLMHRARIFATAGGLFAIALLAVLPVTLIHSEFGAAALLCAVA